MHTNILYIHMCALTHVHVYICMYFHSVCFRQIIAHLETLGPFQTKHVDAGHFSLQLERKQNSTSEQIGLLFAVPIPCCLFCIVFAIPISIKYSSSLQKAIWNNLDESHQIEIHFEEKRTLKVLQVVSSSQNKVLITRCLENLLGLRYLLSGKKDNVFCVTHIYLPRLFYERSQETFLSRLQIIQTDYFV